MSAWPIALSAAAAAGSAVAAVYAGMAHHRQSRQRRSVEWLLEREEGARILRNLGPGDAYDVEVECSEGALLLDGEAVARRPLIPANSFHRVGVFAAPHPDMRPGVVPVSWRERPAGDRKTWSAPVV
jgi:hypothetical protein